MSLDQKISLAHTELAGPWASRGKIVPKLSKTFDIYSTVGPSSNQYHHQAESGVQRGVVGTVLPREITGESWETGQTVRKQPFSTTLIIASRKRRIPLSFDVKCVKIKEENKVLLSF